MPDPKLPKHHYIPVFYLKEWATRPDGRLVEFSMPYKGIVKPQHKHPDATGYVRGLYRMPGVAEEFAEIIEQTFFKKVDDQAAYAHQRQLQRGKMTLRMREAWTLFILSILMRSPKAVADTFEKFTEDLPEQWEEAKKQWAIDFPNELPLGDYNLTVARQYALVQLRRFIANDAIGLLIHSMIWTCLDLRKERYRLLTSDRPVIMTNGLGYVDSHLAMPLSPTMLFVAANTQQTLNSIKAMSVRNIVSNCNKQVVRRAVKYVWGQDHSQDALVLGQMSAQAAEDPSMFSPQEGPMDGKELIPLAKKLSV
jgi:hypothetical protein